MEILTPKNAKKRERVSFDAEAVIGTVLEIKSDVINRGDDALRELTLMFDKIRIDGFLASPAKMNAAYNSIAKDDLAMLKTAARRIRKVNEAVLASKGDIEVNGDGYSFKLVSTPISSVGLYVPGGTAFYPSSVLMLGIAAKVAGVPRIVLCTPPNAADKGIPPITLATAKLVGIDEVYQVGGAQAVFGMAYGTDSIKPADKIFGPGNKYVAAAKMFLGDKCGVDIFAGPSEILVLADETANAEFIRADLLSQLEHGTDSPCVLVTTSKKLAVEISDLEANGFIVLVNSINEGIDFANWYKAEHTEVMTKDSRGDSMEIQGGAVFIGQNTCVPMGDYGVSGSNHVIPTGGAARFQSPVSVEDFMIRTEYTEATDTNSASFVPRFADLEGLPAHAKAVSLRFTNFKKQ